MEQAKAEVVQLLQMSLDGAQQKEATKSLMRARLQPGYVQVLGAILCDSSIDRSLLLSAATQFKNTIKSHWNSEEPEDDADPEYAAALRYCLSAEDKHAVRELLLQPALLRGHDDYQLQDMAATCVGEVADQDYPQEWPDLLGRLMKLVMQADSVGVARGALRAMREMLSNLSAEELPPVAERLIPMLLEIFTRADHFDHQMRSNACGAYREVLRVLHQEADTVGQWKLVAKPTMGLWMNAFIEELGKTSPHPRQLRSGGDLHTEVESVHESAYGPRTEALLTVGELCKFFPDVVAAPMAPLMQAIASQLPQQVSMYDETYVQGDNPIDETEVTAFVDLPDFLAALLSLLIDVAESGHVSLMRAAKPLVGSVELSQMLLTLLQLTPAEAEKYELDIDDFIRAEAGESQNTTVRILASSVVMHCGAWFREHFARAFRQVLSQVLQQPPHWRLLEAAMYGTGSLLALSRDAEEAAQAAEEAATLAKWQAAQQATKQVAQSAQAVALASLSNNGDVMLRCRAVNLLRVAYEDLPVSEKSALSMRLMQALQQCVQVEELIPLVLAILGALAEMMKCAVFAEDGEPRDESLVNSTGELLKLMCHLIAHTPEDSQLFSMRVMETLDFCLEANPGAAAQVCGPIMETFVNMWQQSAESLDDMQKQRSLVEIAGTMATLEQCQVPLSQALLPQIGGIFARLQSARQAGQEVAASVPMIAASLMSTATNFLDPENDETHRALFVQYFEQALPSLLREILDAPKVRDEDTGELCEPVSLYLTACPVLVQFLRLSPVDAATRAVKDGLSLLQACCQIVSKLLSDDVDIEEYVRTEVGPLAVQLVRRFSSQLGQDAVVGLLSALVARIVSCKLSASRERLLAALARLYTESPGAVAMFLHQLPQKQTVLEQWAQQCADCVDVGDSAYTAKLLLLSMSRLVSSGLDEQSPEHALCADLVKTMVNNTTQPLDSNKDKSGSIASRAGARRRKLEYNKVPLAAHVVGILSMRWEREHNRGKLKERVARMAAAEAALDIDEAPEESNRFWNDDGDDNARVEDQADLFASTELALDELEADLRGIDASDLWDLHDDEEALQAHATMMDPGARDDPLLSVNLREALEEFARVFLLPRAALLQQFTQQGFLSELQQATLQKMLEFVAKSAQQ